MSKLIRSLVLGVVALAGVQASAIAGYSYVGSWIVGNGPQWDTNPTVFSGQSAAAFLFGGSASDYAISTIDNNVLNINRKTFVDGWGDDQYLFNPAADDFSLGAPNYNDNPGAGNAYSAYVLDHTCFNRYNNINAQCQGDGVQYVNYAFRLDRNNVPEPAGIVLVGLALVGLGITRRRKNRTN